MVDFRTGLAHLVDRRPFEAGRLPDSEKERLCRSLLAEFGAIHINQDRDELKHGCLLPFATHKNQAQDPTASLNFKKLTYRCLGLCDAGGGLLWFIATCRGCSTDEAREWLEEQTGTGPDEQSLSSLLEFFDAVYSSEERVVQPMPRMSERVLEPWKVIHPYLTEIRRIPEENIVRLTVGYGTFRIRISANKWIDSERIVIPHFWKGDLVGWQTRRLLSDGTPKYQNSPDFPKDRTIYNWEPTEEAVVVESPLSVASKVHLDPHIEGTFGRAIPDAQVRVLSYHRKIILFMDNDVSGWRATQRLGEALEPYCSVWAVNNPYAADPADLDDATYLGLLKSAEPFSIWKPPEHVEEWNR